MAAPALRLARGTFCPRSPMPTPFLPRPPYIGKMPSDLTGPVAQEIDQRLRAALAPTRLEVINDSARHRGHAGDDGSGESHFTVEIEAPAFAGMSRLERRRAVNAALGDLMKEPFQALATRPRS